MSERGSWTCQALTSETIVRPYVPGYTGKSFVPRIINQIRRGLPRLTHFVEALAGLRLAERYTGLVWRPVLRVPADYTGDIIVAPDLKSALPRLFTLRGRAFVNVGGLAYEVVPANAMFVDAADQLSRRAYATYEEYIRHQASKLDQEEAAIRRTSERRYEKMASRFAEIVKAAHLSGSVLCLGARLGEEVRAFRRAGMEALGVDLNPGADNPDCLYADFHHLPFRDDAFDGAYSNVLDHVLDMTRFMEETVRIVRPGGFIFFELTGGYSETGAVDPYGATLWPTNAALVKALLPYISDIILDRDEQSRSRRVIVFRPLKASATESQNSCGDSR